MVCAVTPYGFLYPLELLERPWPTRGKSVTTEFFAMKSDKGRAFSQEIKPYLPPLLPPGALDTGYA